MVWQASPLPQSCGGCISRRAIEAGPGNKIEMPLFIEYLCSPASVQDECAVLRLTPCGLQNVFTACPAYTGVVTVIDQDTNWTCL